MEYFLVFTYISTKRYQIAQLLGMANQRVDHDFHLHYARRLNDCSHKLFQRQSIPKHTQYTIHNHGILIILTIKSSLNQLKPSHLFGFS